MQFFFLAFLALVLAGGIAAAQRVVAYEIVDAREIPASLTGRPGDPEAGRALYFDEKLARCAGCHGDPAAPAPDAPPEGTPAPDAAPDSPVTDSPVTDSPTDAPPLGAAGRRLGEGAVRLWLVAPQVIAPETGMPAYYALGQRMDPADPRFGEPLLTAAEIEDLVAFLMQPAAGP